MFIITARCSKRRIVKILLVFALLLALFFALRACRHSAPPPIAEANMIKRIDQQFKVTYIMIDYMAQFNLVSKPLERYMRHYLSIIMCISSVIAVKSGTKEHLKMRKELWKYLYGKDKRLYRKIRHNITSCAVNLPGYVGRKATIGMYKAARKFIGFN